VQIESNYLGNSAKVIIAVFEVYGVPFILIEFLPNGSDLHFTWLSLLDCDLQISFQLWETLWHFWVI
jgi:hypothetical protein